jgi:hypothetical protein
LGCAGFLLKYLHRDLGLAGPEHQTILERLALSLAEDPPALQARALLAGNIFDGQLVRLELDDAKVSCSRALV